MTDNTETDEKRLCLDCVDEPFLANLMGKHGKTAVCDYCGRTGRTETVAQLADRFEAMFDQHFEREGEVDYRWDEPRGETVEFIIANSGRLPDTAASDIQSVMENRHSDLEAAQMGDQTAYDSELTYVESHVDDRELQDDWSHLELELKTKRRFFSREAEAGFDRLFAGVHGLKTRDGRPVVRMIGPDTNLPALFRARAFQSNALFNEALIEPERFVGSPESRHARAGRMNAQGVSVFYGASTEALALAEVRPPVGSRAVTGRFDLLQTLILLDVEALESVLVQGSVFDPEFSGRLERAAFLARLARRIRMPVMPDDEAMDYLVTQVMADYLADRLAPPLDGVAYGSAQGVDGAFNVALFNRSARVEARPKPSGAVMEVYASGGDEELDAYTVWIEIDSSKAEVVEPKDHDLLAFAPVPPDREWDPRPETLRLDRDSLQVHHIKRVCIDSAVVGVRQTVWDKSDEPF